MMTIRETINNEVGGNRYSYIELYDNDTDMPIYNGIAWDCPYANDYIVKCYHTYNMDNKVCFTMWIDFMDKENKDDYIVIPYDETTEIHNTPLGEMTTSEFMKWIKTIEVI